MPGFRQLFFGTMALASMPFIYLFQRFFGPTRKAVKHYNDPKACANILACIGINSQVPDNQLTPVLSRAIPNNRLVQAFGINNAFTTSDDDFRQEFHDNASRILIATNKKWKDIAQATEQVLNDQVQVSDGEKRGIALVPLVQSLTLKTSIHVLFQEDPLALNDELVSSFAKVINDLWIQSKDSSTSEYHGALRQKFRRDLSSLFPSHSLSTRDTPMNLIIPAYETLWRVVLNCFIEVAFRHPSSAAAWQSVLAEYMANPTENFFKRHSPSPEETESVSAYFLAKEALRLYPPTRRIYRVYRPSSGSEYFTLAADIESLHRNSDYWGTDSKKYVPARWASLTPESRKAYFPFGGSQMMCPASKGFGRKMIALLVAVLVCKFGTGEWELDEHEEIKTEPIHREVDAYPQDGRRLSAFYKKCIHDIVQFSKTVVQHLKAAVQWCSNMAFSSTTGSQRKSVFDISQPLDSSREAHTSLRLRRKDIDS